MRSRLLSAAAATVVLGVVAAVAAPVQAGPPGTWTVISGGGVVNIDEPGLYRTSDGTLHVAMHRNAGDLEYIDVGHITESGKLTGRTDAIGGWEAATVDPELVGSPDGGMRMVFGGIHSLDQADPYIAGYLWQTSAPAAGSPWTLSPSPAVTQNTGYASYGTGATTLADGTLAAAYPLNSTIYYQIGAGPPQSFTVADCCVYHVALASDGASVWASWSANGDGAANMGIFVRQIYPALGPVMQAPGSVSSFGGSPGTLDPGQRTALVARNGGGLYLAYLNGYPSAKAVALWKVGSSSFSKVPGSKGATHVDMSAGPSGRLWIAFDDSSDDLHAVRTDTQAKDFGAVRTLQRPGSASTVYHVFIEGTRARADLLFNDSQRIWHQQLFAGLTLKASPAKWNGNDDQKVEFKVTDAGEGVKGATVKAKWNGQKLTCKTEDNGKCTIHFPKLGKSSIKVTAKKSGYAPDETTLKVS